MIPIFSRLKKPMPVDLHGSSVSATMRRSFALNCIAAEAVE